ncbi:hypothetical protein [Amnibacterium setariae]|uniref:DUF3137 domain-containing protein n=1 Tax=Amnibacterium setariae TaxID=2306585 RepID=A0A3A1U466_9MICO|nr:hypothetical protein [Amnibacterium setariae]RIX30227.1 hypothetical protein D1781_01915 [Amnibacterium setariae]
MRAPVLDLTSLTEPVTAEEVSVHRRDAVARGEAPSTGALLRRVGVPAVTALVALVALVVVAATGRPAWTVVVALLVALVGTLSAVRTAAASRRSWRTWAVLDRFATRNGLRLVPEYAAPADLAVQLRRGKQRRRTEWIRFPGDRIQVANHRYSVTSGGGDARSTSVYRVGLVVVRLDRAGPRLVIDAMEHDRHRRATGSHAPRGALDQVVLQRPDFDRSYRLYLQAGTGQEAMAALSTRLVDALAAAAATGTPWDLEVVEGTAYFMQPRFLDLTDPATWRRITDLVAAVG